MLVPRTGNTTKFIKWAPEALFAFHVGPDEQNNKLVSIGKGGPHASFQQFFPVRARDTMYSFDTSR